MLHRGRSCWYNLITHMDLVNQSGATHMGESASLQLKLKILLRALNELARPNVEQLTPLNTYMNLGQALCPAVRTRNHQKYEVCN